MSYTLPSDFVINGAAVGSCASGCPKKCGKGTKSVYALAYYNFYAPFDHISGQGVGPAGEISFQSFFPPIKYLTMSIRRTFYDGSVMNFDCTFDPINGNVTTNVLSDTYASSPLFAFFSLIPDPAPRFLIGPQFVQEFGGGAGVYSLEPLAYSALIPNVGGRGSNPNFCVSESITLSNPYTLAQAVAAANGLVATVGLTLPGVYTLTSGPTVTFDYPGSNLQPGTSALISGITVNADGTFSKSNSAGLSVFDEGGVPAVSGIVAANGLPSGLGPPWPLPYNFPPTLLGATGVADYINGIISLATAVKYTITAERTGTIDTQPFDVPLSPCLGKYVGGLVPFQGDVIPPVEPASVNLIPNAEMTLATPLLGETIYTPGDAPAYGILGVALKTTAPASVGAGSTADTAGSQQNISGGSAGL